MSFADDDASEAIGKLAVKDGTDRVAIYGSLYITRDKAGLAHAQALLAVLPAEPPKAVANPFE